MGLVKGAPTLDITNIGAYTASYRKAAREEKESFDFEGHEQRTEYAKCVIQYFQMILRGGGV